MHRTMEYTLNINLMLENKICLKSLELFLFRMQWINFIMKWEEIIRSQEIESILSK